MEDSNWQTTLTGHLRTGAVLNLVPAGEVADPGVADQWGEDRRIPAGVVREVLLWAARNPHQVDPKGLRVRGADVTGLVDLDNMNLPCPVKLADCRLADGITLDGATLPDLVLARSHIGTPTLPHDRAISASGLVIKGQLVLRGAHLTNSGDALALDRASITGSVILDDGFTAAGQVRALGATIGGQLVLSGAHLTNLGGHALALDRASITGSVILDDGFTAEGEVRANGATIGGSLVLSGAHLTNLGGHALALDGADITGAVFLDDGFTAAGQVRANGASIGGSLVLSGAHLTNLGGHALALDGADITGAVFLDDGFTAEGEVCANGATIGGPLAMSGAKLTNPDGHALAIDRAHITGDVLLDKGFAAQGQVSAPGATIGGHLALTGTTLTNADGYALVLDGADVTGSVIMGGVTAEGEVRARGVTIGRGLNLSGAHLTNPDGHALVLDGADVTGSVFLTGGFTADGEVRALGATVGGTLVLRGATLTNPDGTAVTLEDADVKTVLLDKVKDITGTVDLVSCRIDTLLCPSEGYPPGDLAATGWRVRFVHGQAGTDAKTAQAWLNTRLDHVPYSPQPGRELADMYDRSGHPDQARKMRHNAAQGITKHSTGWTRLRLSAYNLIAGHGYYPHRVIGWLAVIFAIAIAVTATSPQLFEPADYPKAAAAARTAALQTGNPAPPTITGATPCPQLGTYPCFPRFTYALQTVVPPATVITTTAWQPATNTILALFTILKAAGWILVVLFLATITGLLKRT